MMFLVSFFLGFFLVLALNATTATNGDVPFEISPIGWINYLKNELYKEERYYDWTSRTYKTRIEDNRCWALVFAPGTLGFVIGGCLATLIPSTIALYIELAILGVFLLMFASGAKVYYVGFMGTSPFLGGIVTVGGIIVTVVALL